MTEMTVQTASRVRVVTIPSRTGGNAHVIVLDAFRRTPIDAEHVCSCKAGSSGRWCWAALQALQEHGNPKIAAAAKTLANSRESGKRANAS